MNMLRKAAISALLGAAVSILSLPAFAHAGHDEDNTGKEKRALLQRKALPDAPGKFGLMATVTYEPGQASKPHRHPGSVFAYVLEGEVVSQLANGEAITYKAGDSWYETPQIPHTMSRNASTTKPAKLLVWLLMADGEEIAQPLDR
jgi:quercetin dioxygenase-like cupin family protein